MRIRSCLLTFFFQFYVFDFFGVFVYFGLFLVYGLEICLIRKEKYTMLFIQVSIYLSHLILSIIDKQNIIR